MKKLLEAKDLSVGYIKSGQADAVVLSGLNLTIEAGSVVCLLGPNGTGKSTLLRTLGGLQPALKGLVQVDQTLIDPRHIKKLARTISVVLTDRVDIRNFRVYDLVATGRYPYNNWLGRLSKLDKEKIEWALSQVHLDSLKHRDILELSDGELQRALIAKALAQDTALILLDEPTAHLDLPNKIATMQLLRQLAKETQKSVVLTTHDLDLALQTAHVIWLIQSVNQLVTGSPEELVATGKLESAFAGIQIEKETNSRYYRIDYPTI